MEDIKRALAGVGGGVFLLALSYSLLCKDEMSAICILMFQVWKPELRTKS